jgi:Ca2+-binding EF-hand superfamily protein
MFQRLGLTDIVGRRPVTKSIRTAFALAALSLSAPLLAQTGPKPVSRADFLKDIDNRFAAADTNKDGAVAKAELVTLQQKELQQAKAGLNQQLQARFRQLDTNKNGALSLQEFAALAPAMRTAETPDQLLKTLDSNGDGKISNAEFRAPQLAKFNNVDANRDGIATPEEMRKAATGK